MVMLPGGAVWEEEEGLPHPHAEVWRDNPLGEMARRQYCTSYTALHYTALHYTALHYTALHYTALHYTALHYIALRH